MIIIHFLRIHIIKFLTHLRINNYTNDDIQNITLKINIIYFNRLRHLEELEVFCSNQKIKISYIYIFNCSTEVSQKEISIVKYINNSIKINGNEIKNLEMLEIAQLMGDNIQNQTKDILSADVFILEDSILIDNDRAIIIEGKNNITDLTSNSADLLYVEDNNLKNISCIVQKGEINNTFKVTCSSVSLEQIDLNLNNILNLKDQKKNVIIGFRGFREGDSKLNSTKQSFHYFPKKKNRKLSAGGIVAIILSILAALSILIASILLLKPKPKVQQTIKNSVPKADSEASFEKN